MTGFYRGCSAGPIECAWYDDRMKTLLITDGAVPDRLREVITRGSTSLEQRRTNDDTSGGLPDADRIVFWSTGADAALRQLAERYARAEHAARREAIVFVTTASGESVPGLSEIECFQWPQDEDRLRMAFLTGA
jgi:hypothetical protein